MKLLLKKEAALCAHPISYFFIAFALMTMLPGYPILVGSFFVCFGLFQTYQSAREANDLLYTAMLPVNKRDVVRAKFSFALLIELSGFLLSAALTALRMAVFSAAPVYTNNAMMNANPAYLGYALIIYAAFNIFFIGGFFRSSYKIGVPFVVYSVVSLLVIGLGETLHHLHGLGALNSTSFEKIQLIPLLAGAVIFALGTYFSMLRSIYLFDKTDL